MKWLFGVRLPSLLVSTGIKKPDTMTEVQDDVIVLPAIFGRLDKECDKAHNGNRHHLNQDLNCLDNGFVAVAISITTYEYKRVSEHH